jgi:hypothetical protein
MASCKGSFEFEISEWDIPGEETAEKALEAARRKILAVISYNNQNKCKGDCYSTDDDVRCTPTVDKKDLDDFIATLVVDEFSDVDGDPSYGVTIPNHKFTLHCRCRKNAKKKKLISLVSLDARPVDA